MAVTLVQQATPGVSTGTTTPQASWPAATTAGNLLVAVVGLSLVANPGATVTPPSGWVLAGDIPSAANCQTLIYYIEGAASRSGAEVFNLTSTLVNDATVFLYEYSGLASSGALDQEGEATGTSLSGSSGTTGTTAQADELAIAAVANRNVSTQSAPTNSFTQLDQAQSTSATTSNRVNTGVYSRVVAATGTYGTAVTLSGATSRPWTGVVVTFKGAPTGLQPPTGLSATPISSSEIDLAWTAAAGASSYDVERDGTIVIPSVVGTAFADTGLSPSTLYSYRVRSVA